MSPRRKVLAAAFSLLLLIVTPAAPARADGAAPVPRFSHVVEVMLENESATATFEDAAAAPGLARLRAQGVYLPQFFASGHASLSNYEASFAGVEPTAQGKSDCLGQPYSSCIFPASVPTLGAVLDARGLAWKVYSEGMTGAPGGHDCLHAPSRNAPDPYQGPGANGYATRHNPAPWFASVLDHGGSEDYCQAHSVDLEQLWKDAASPQSLPAWSFVEPDTCHDGHDTEMIGGCALDPEGPGAPSGVAAIDAWLPGFVNRLTSSRGWDDQSLLVITFDEGGTDDTAGCAPCHDTSAGGRIGALLIGAPVARPGTVEPGWHGDHYSLLRTWESAWGLPTLKSRAASPAAAATVHDGDPGVTPLPDVWKTAAAGAATATATASTTAQATAAPKGTCRPSTLRIRLGRGTVRAVAYLDGRRVAAARGRTVIVRRPPPRAFALRIVATRRDGTRVRLSQRFRLVGTGAACRLRPSRGP